MEWLIPKNVADIRSFMGLASYYHHFIVGFSRESYPITSLHEKGKPFNWNLACKKKFDQLKHLLTTTHILRITDHKKLFLVCTNTSQEGVGDMLMQEGWLIAYES